MNKQTNTAATRPVMVNVNQSRFAAEILCGNARVNLTQMAKPFGKTPKDWLRTDEAQRYLEAVAVWQKCLTTDLVEIRQGGSPENQGTWCNDYRIALRYAQWLSPEFSILVDETMLRLLSGRKQQAPRRTPPPRERDEVMRAFYAELPQWVTHQNEAEVAAFFGLTRGHVHKVLMGHTPAYAVLRALVEHGKANRRAGIRRAVCDRAEAQAKIRQLALVFTAGRPETEQTQS